MGNFSAVTKNKLAVYLLMEHGLVRKGKVQDTVITVYNILHLC